MCVVNEEHPMCDSGQLRLLSFIGAMVGGGVQRSPVQVALNWVMCKGAVPEAGPYVCPPFRSQPEPFCH